MKLYVDGAEKEITLRAWNGERWGEDFFDALVEDHLTWGAEITGEQYAEEVGCWEAEVEKFNAGEPTETWGNPDAWEGWESTAELCFDYEEA